MGTAKEIFDEIREKVYKVFSHGLARDELTILVPLRKYYELVSYCGERFIVKNIEMSYDKVDKVTLMGVTLKPVEGLDKIYVCL